MKTRTLTVSAILSAIAVMLALALHFPIFPAAPFLEYDPADIPIILGSFIFGPGVGMIITIVASVLQGVTVSGGSGIIGILMHIVATGSFVLVSGLLHKKFKSLGGLIFSALMGILAWVVMMIGWNLVMTPIFMGTPREAVLSIMLPVIIPFNLIKAGVNTFLATALYIILSPKLKLTFGKGYVSFKKVHQPPDYVDNIDYCHNYNADSGLPISKVPVVVADTNSDLTDDNISINTQEINANTDNNIAVDKMTFDAQTITVDTDTNNATDNDHAFRDNEPTISDDVTAL